MAQWVDLSAVGFLQALNGLGRLGKTGVESILWNPVRPNPLPHHPQTPLTHRRYYDQIEDFQV